MSDDLAPTAPAAPAKPAKAKLPKEQSLVLGILGARARGRKQYGDAKKYQEQLLKLVKPGKKITLGDGRTFIVADVFANATKGYVSKIAIIDRYELQEVAG